jgi:hypothetical protein
VRASGHPEAEGVASSVKAFAASGAPLTIRHDFGADWVHEITRTPCPDDEASTVRWRSCVGSLLSEPACTSQVAALLLQELELMVTALRQARPGSPVFESLGLAAGTDGRPVKSARMRRASASMRTRDSALPLAAARMRG